jgi:hypothetical protein
VSREQGRALAAEATAVMVATGPEHNRQVDCPLIQRRRQPVLGAAPAIHF